MVADPKGRLNEIINGYLDRDGGAGVDTGVVAGHLAQMKLFGIRQGVEFFPAQDNFGAQRKDYLDRVIKLNQLDTIEDVYLPRLLERLCPVNMKYPQSRRRERQRLL